MWTSVPQMAVLRMRISTSLMPISGTGASSSQRPGAACFLTSAFIVFGIFIVISFDLIVKQVGNLSDIRLPGVNKNG